MEFRHMKPCDRAEMQAFYQEMGEESTYFFNRGHGNENLTMSFFEKELPNHEFFVMTEGDHVIGLSFLWDIHSLVPWFGIAVRESYKGKHVGTAMLEAVLDILKARGCGGLLLTTAQNNYRGQGLYEKCGFERLGVHPSGEFLYLRRFSEEEVQKTIRN